MSLPNYYHEPMKDHGPYYPNYSVKPGRDPYYNPHIPDGKVHYMHDYRYKGFINSMMERPTVPITYSPRTSKNMNEILSSPPHSPINFLSSSENIKESGSIKYGSNLLPGLPGTEFLEQSFSNSTNTNNEQDSTKWKRHQIDVENEITRFKEEKKNKMLEHKIEQHQDLHMLNNYNPWGKPGGGAPNPNNGNDDDDIHKRKKFTEIDLRQDKSPQHSNNDQTPFYRPGAGAPMRTSSGRLITEIPGDPAIRFRENNRGVELSQSIRYKGEPDKTDAYAKELEKLMDEQNQLRNRQRREELQAELQTLQYHPYGKPGAGAPNRPYNGQTFSPVNMASLSLGHGSGAGDPIRTVNGEAMTRLPITMDRTNRGENTINDDPHMRSPRHHYPEPTIYFPFGTAGGGAPNLDNRGQVQTTVLGESTFRRDVNEEEKKAIAARMYHNDLQLEMMEQKLKKMQERQDLRAPFSPALKSVNDFSSIMAQGRTGHPRRDPNTGILSRQDLNSTDVTQAEQFTPRLSYQNQPVQFANDSKAYSNDLEHAAQERYKHRQLEKLKEQQQARLHGEVSSSIWGRPGGGAPRVNDNRMINLTEALHYPNGGYSPVNYKNEYVNSLDHSASLASNNVKNHMRSDHSNRYEIAPKQHQGHNYHSTSAYPFAVHSHY